MDAKELFKEGGTTASLWYCDTCNSIFESIATAESCCKPKICRCGKRCVSPLLMCMECRDAKQKETANAKVLLARKVSAAEWCGPVWPRGSDGFLSLEDAIDHYDSIDKVPTPIWGTRETRLRLSAKPTIDNALEDMYEDAGSYIKDEDIYDLQKLLDEWCERCGPPPGYEEDDKVVIILDE